MGKERAPGKTRITIRLDTDVIAWFRREVRSSEGSYQTAINAALRDFIVREPIEATLRRVVREELARSSGSPPEGAHSYGRLAPALVADAGAESAYGSAPARRTPGLPRPGRAPIRTKR